MRLINVDVEPVKVVMPDDVHSFVAEARCRIDQIEDDERASIPAFVPSDFDEVYRALLQIHETRIATGRRFVEWGSGVGVVTCLASKVGFDAVGIEIESLLVDIAESLARRFGIAAQFVCGSFVPPGAEPLIDLSGEVTWLRTDAADAYAELELDPDDFDLVFAYPWPGEEQLIFDLFKHCAAVGALLLTYHSQEGLRLQRKVRK
jgi:hypothetical protein